MSLDLSFFKRPTNISAKVLTHSINLHGVEMITLEIEYPRFILAELNTHKALEKNSSSSRAIPFLKMVENIESNMAIPLYWGENKSGMQADSELTGLHLAGSKQVWKNAFSDMKEHANWMHQTANLHKQTINRLLEPHQMMKTVISGTDWDNFFNLRLHPDAQPEFCMLAYKIYQAIKTSRENGNVFYLQRGEWHLPYVNRYRIKSGRGRGLIEYHLGEVGTDSYKQLTLVDAIKISASCTAQTSYRKNDESLEKAEKIFDMLIGAEVLHASPFGHLATPIEEHEELIDDYDEDAGVIEINLTYHPDTWQEGITHMNRAGQLCSANLRTYIQYRHLLKNNTCWEFDYDERMKLFDK